MRSVLLLAALVLAACAAMPAEPPTRGQTPGRACRIDGADRFIGRPATSETGAEILRATNSAVLRWAPAGTMLTMDYRQDRVTVYLGADGKLSKINCD